MAEASDRKFLG